MINKRTHAYTSQQISKQKGNKQTSIHISKQRTINKRISKYTIQSTNADTNKQLKKQINT